MNDIKRLEKKVNYALSVEEIREIQKEEIHKFIGKWAYASFWFASLCGCNVIGFSMIAEAHNDILIELKALAFIFNVMVNAGGYWLIKNTLKGRL